ncbi:quinolinate synthase NadA, partial [Candidatus Bathyarchaeota archaeon]|nr:quinolinate synthase NadA [Candidatus Bathyarchaeota archaeon]
IPIPKHGFCYVHKLFSEGDIHLAREQHPDAEVLAHPECNPEVQLLADFIGSTGQMYRHAKESPKKELVIATEIGLIDRLKRELPGKEYIPAYTEAICSSMKLNTLEKIYLALKNEDPVVTLPKPIMKKAHKAVEKMTEIVGR